MRIAGLIQARMGSTRLPGKVMLELAGRPMAGHIIDRLEAVPTLCGIVLATTIDPRNDGLVDYAHARGISVFRARGEDDIAERLAGATLLMRADAILKVNGDCPFVDPKVLARLTAAFEAVGDADYASNKIAWTYPLGLSAEVIAMRAIEWCDANLTEAHDRELVANWIKEHPGQFKQVSVTCDRDLSRFNWTVDTPEDFSFVERVFSALHPLNPVFGLDEVLEYLRMEKDTGLNSSWKAVRP